MRRSDLGEIRAAYQIRGAVAREEGGANPLIQLGDVRDEGIDMSRLTRMNLGRVREADRLRPGDILLRSRGASYRAQVVTDCPPETVAAAPLYVLRLQQPGILPNYLVWY